MAAGRPIAIVGAVPGNEALTRTSWWAAAQGIACAPSGVGREVSALRDRGALEAMGAQARALVQRGSADRVVGLSSEVACRGRLAA